MGACILAVTIAAITLFVVYVRGNFSYSYLKLRNMYLCTHRFVSSEAKLALIEYNSKIGKDEMKKVLSSQYARCIQTMIMVNEDTQVCVWEADTENDILDILASFQDYYAETKVQEITELIHLK
tara:strand:- start:2941 stop:3312 length:372 start_codon:yes stop_codon:yes gene_type:complete